MGLIGTLSLALGSSWVSGINLYAAVAMLGLLGRFGHLHLPGELQALTSPWVIGIAGLLYLVEFVADKVPYVDSLWDTLHTFIRVPAGAVLAAAAFGDFDKSVQVIAFLLGGGIALSSHGTKTVTRAVANASPEPVTNITLSLVEDAIAFGSIALAAFHPVLLFLVVGTGLLISFYLLPRAVRTLRRGFVRLREWRTGGNKPEAAASPLP